MKVIEEIRIIEEALSYLNDVVILHVSSPVPCMYVVTNQTTSLVLYCN